MIVYYTPKLAAETFQLSLMVVFRPSRFCLISWQKQSMSVWRCSILFSNLSPKDWIESAICFRTSSRGVLCSLSTSCSLLVDIAAILAFFRSVDSGLCEKDLFARFLLFLVIKGKALPLKVKFVVNGIIV